MVRSVLHARPVAPSALHHRGPGASALLALLLLLPVGCGGDGGATTGPNDGGGDPAVTSVSVAPASASVAVGETVQLVATARDGDGRPVSTGFVWTSQAPSVATVSSSGVVTGREEGRAVVTAESGGVSGSATVDVSPPSLEGTLAGVETALGDLMPPPGTPFDQRDMVGELRTLAQALLERPEIITTRVDPASQTLQIDRIDGTSILVANSRPPHPGESLSPRRSTTAPELAAPAAPPDPAVVAGGPTPVGPPSSRKAVWISIDGGASVGAEVGSLLSQAGYDVSNPVGSLDDMRALSGLGALYLDTHGVVWVPVLDVVLDEAGEAVGKVDGDPVYALQTTTVVDVSEFATLREELENREIVVSYSQNALTERWEAHLAITERFIERHWSFDEAVVMIHACNGGRGPVAGGWDCFGLCDPDDPYDPTPLRSAILGRGADVVVAFDNITWPTNARPSVLYLFDRLLGTNEYDPEVVPNRPFDLADVMAGMQRKDLLSFELGSADVNVTFDVADNRVTLAPAVETLDVVDDDAAGEGEITLHGTFGGDPGEVEVDGTPAAVETWTDDRVTARVPFEGAGARGDVVAIKPDGVESNGVPLTEWEGTVTVTITPGAGSLRAEAEMDVRFRADVHPYRNEVDGTTMERSVRTYMSPASEGEVRGSGSVTEDGTTVSFYGTEPIQLLTRAQIDAGGPGPGGGVSTFGGFVDLDPDANQAQVCFSLFGQVDVRTVTSEGTFESRVEIILLPFELFDGVVDGMRCLFLPLGSDYRIPAGSTDFREGDFRIELAWTAFQPASPPDDQTPG